MYEFEAHDKIWLEIQTIFENKEGGNYVMAIEKGTELPTKVFVVLNPKSDSERLKEAFDRVRSAAYESSNNTSKKEGGS